MAVPVEGGHPVLRVPLTGSLVDDWKGTYDYLDLKVSPDREYFYLLFGASASTDHLIARTADAAVIFREPHRALTFDPEFFTTWRIRWPGATSEGKKAYVYEGEGPFRFVIDLQTGSRQGPSDDDLTVLEPVPGRGELGAVGDEFRWNNSSFSWSPEELLTRVLPGNPEP